MTIRFGKLASFAAVSAAVSITAAASQAEVFGEFVFQGSANGGQIGPPTFVPEGFAFDTWTFDVTNNTSETIVGFGLDATDNIAFFGEFLQAGGQSNAATPTLGPDPLSAAPQVESDALEDDTFFIGSGDIVASLVVDTDSELSASFFGSSGFSIAPGETASIAFFSVAPGTTPSGGIGALAISESGAQTEIVIPEPASIALLAAGLGIAGLRRRSA